MDPEFWHRRWQDNEIGFHEPRANPALVRNLELLGQHKGSRFFLPLCGKTLDIGWLLGRGFQVAGAELSQLAVEQLFEELGVSPEVSDLGKLKHYRAPNLDIFCGDIFELSSDILGPVDATFDRAALVALPQQMRHRYVSQLVDVTRHAPQLLVTFVYDQALMAGPPFSIDDDEVNCRYQEHYQLRLLESKAIPDGLKGLVPAEQHVWLLRRPAT
ncbi:thiopurine S-methyltransferase [Microbulbifer flavimaris]|uniref:Thiopurine S-methyltransferase n=1 Tax=Microbulbifer flavimaris TaxID=1781068 RepID=A0ABX4I2V5_9GAMM|nr:MULTISPECIES: thiopurine S-methyltransferase [Microbulbifer]KUJ84661.1 thiopurine S-methyltransferase [Microbulbifer sp. ZGT114]PCO06749.1 thiopurine S-methyltransferase [Microbulbifer flavimaris]